MGKKLTTDEWVAKAKLVHGDKYDYSEVNYVNSKTKIKITCQIHGAFWQVPSSHLLGYDCKDCGKLKQASKRKLNLDEFVTKVNNVHNNKYNYDKVIYKNNSTKVEIVCPVHGTFKQRPADHLQGKGCNKCSSNQKYTTEEFVEKAKLVHTNRYNYDKTTYTGSKTKVIITCPIHGDFEQAANNHLHGKGCPSCAKNGFDVNKPAILYYLKITTEENKTLYKIGITNRTVNERFNLTDLSKIEIIKQEKFKIGTEALNKETAIKRKFKKYRYSGSDVLESGNTELFTKDILDEV